MNHRVRSRQQEHSVKRIEAAFIAQLPRIERVAHWKFRHISCPDRKNECVRETVALCWSWHQRLASRNRDSSQFASAMARFAVKAVSSGRRLTGQESAVDVLSPVCKRRRGYTLSSLDDKDDRFDKSIHEALQHNVRTAIPDQVQFRCDFPEWRKTLDDRRRLFLDAMMMGGTTKDMAAQFGTSSGRISQLRREFFEGYMQFCGDASESV